MIDYNYLVKVSVVLMWIFCIPIAKGILSVVSKEKKDEEALLFSVMWPMVLFVMFIFLFVVNPIVEWGGGAIHLLVKLGAFIGRLILRIKGE